MNIATGRPVESKGSGFNLEALKLKSKADIEIETMLEENKWFPDAKRWVSYAIKIRKSLVINDRLHLGFSVGEVMESIVDELVDQRMLEAVNKLKTIAEEDKGILETPCGLETSSYFRSAALDFLHVGRKLRNPEFLLSPFKIKCDKDMSRIPIFIQLAQDADVGAGITPNKFVGIMDAVVTMMGTFRCPPFMFQKIQNHIRYGMLEILGFFGEDGKIQGNVDVVPIHDVMIDHIKWRDATAFLKKGIRIHG